MKQVQPINKQAGTGSLSAQTRDQIVKFIREEMDDMLPARVVSYDDATNRAVIHPVVMLGLEDGSKMSRGTIPDVPVFRFGGGGFFMRFPLKPGDMGWIKANDRDLSLFKQAQGQGEDWPNTERLHGFEDAMFYPDTFRQWIVSAANADAATWQSLDGVVCVSLHADKVRVDAPKVEVVATTSVMVTAPSVAVNASGTIALTSGVLTHNGKNIGATHTHVGPPTAPTGAISPTGAPV